MNPTRRPEPTEPTEPEDAWLQERYPAASADFVARTLARVMADRARIEVEARKVEDIRFDPEVLARLHVPEVAPDFVERTLDRVLRQHKERASGERALRELVQQYEVPPVSEDFVRRTLSALGVGTQRPATTVRRWPFAWAAAAAALLLATTLLLGPLLVARTAPVGRPTAAFTPVRFGTVLATGASLRGERLGDGLVALAYLGSLRNGEGGR